MMIYKLTSWATASRLAKSEMFIQATQQVNTAGNHLPKPKLNNLRRAFDTATHDVYSMSKRHYPLNSVVPSDFRSLIACFTLSAIDASARVR
jgi:hypothetical protein